MREIPTLQVLCLRTVGSNGCNAEDTFAKTPDGKPSASSRLLRSFRNAVIPIPRSAAVGTGSARRNQANDVDLNHPWIAEKVAILVDKTTKTPSSHDDGNDNDDDDDDAEQQVAMNLEIQQQQPQSKMYSEMSDSALDVLQCYIDSLVELGRMDDGRLGLHFFQEWKTLVCEGNSTSSSSDNNNNISTTTPPPQKKRRRSNAGSTTTTTSTNSSSTTKLGSLSLHNAVLMDETIQAMVESEMTFHLGVLDLTGIQTLTDSFLQEIISRAPQLQRLAVKNCRRLTQASLEAMAEHSSELYSLDIGGSYNLQPAHVLELVAALPHLVELHASGLGWTDALLQDLTSMRSWKALSLGFVPFCSAAGLKAALVSQSESLTSLAVPFCEHIVDAAFLGTLGRHLPFVKALDVRGNSSLNSMTGWYDGRATIVPPVPPQPLTVLARYSGISKNSLEDTKRIHPLQASNLMCVLDSGGIGEGIQRVSSTTMSSNTI